MRRRCRLVKLRRVHAYSRKGVDYYRWDVSLPSKSVRELKWRDGDELEWKLTDGALTLRRKRDGS